MPLRPPLFTRQKLLLPPELGARGEPFRDALVSGILFAESRNLNSLCRLPDIGGCYAFRRAEK
jgi:hypothetical protein